MCMDGYEKCSVNITDVCISGEVMRCNAIAVRCCCIWSVQVKTVHNIKCEWTCLNVRKCKSCSFESATPLTQCAGHRKTCLKCILLTCWCLAYNGVHMISTLLWQHEWNCYITHTEDVNAMKLFHFWHKHCVWVCIAPLWLFASFHFIKCKHFAH